MSNIDNRGKRLLAAFAGAAATGAVFGYYTDFANDQMASALFGAIINTGLVALPAAFVKSIQENSDYNRSAANNTDSGRLLESPFQGGPGKEF
jgi:ethanolamine transporter EutH